MSESAATTVSEAAFRRSDAWITSPSKKGDKRVPFGRSAMPKVGGTAGPTVSERTWPFGWMQTNTAVSVEP